MAMIEVPLYQIQLGRWKDWGIHQEIIWDPVMGLDTTDREFLVNLTPHLLRKPGVVAVRVVRVDQNGNVLSGE